MACTTAQGFVLGLNARPVMVYPNVDLVEPEGQSSQMELLNCSEIQTPVLPMEQTAVFPAFEWVWSTHTPPPETAALSV